MNRLLWSRCFRAPSAPRSLGRRFGRWSSVNTRSSRRLQSTTRTNEIELLLRAAGLPDSTLDEPLDAAHDTDTQRSLDVGIVGAPNAGKSTLTNLLVSKHVSAVSPKVNTTRDTCVGVATHGATQLVFHDTPGFVERPGGKSSSGTAGKSGSGKQRFVSPLRTTVERTLPKLDVVLMLVDASPVRPVVAEAAVRDLADVLSGLAPESRPRVMLGLNKVDQVEPKTRLLELASTLNEIAEDCACFRFDDPLAVLRDGSSWDGGAVVAKEEDDGAAVAVTLGGFQHTFMISALKDDGVDDIRRELLRFAKPREWLFASSEALAQSETEQAAEVVRQYLFQALHRELPYQVAQRNLEWARREDGTIAIHQQLLVGSNSHKRILSSHALLGFVKSRAQADLEKSFGCTVDLRLSVKKRRPQ